MKRFNYFTYHINSIKKRLGKDCTFLSHLERKYKSHSEYYIRAFFKNENGGTDKVLVKIHKEPKELLPVDYEALYDMLKNKEYERSEEAI